MAGAGIGLSTGDDANVGGSCSRSGSKSRWRVVAPCRRYQSTWPQYSRASWEARPYRCGIHIPQIVPSWNRPTGAWCRSRAFGRAAAAGAGGVHPVGQSWRWGLKRRRWPMSPRAAAGAADPPVRAASRTFRTRSWGWARPSSAGENTQSRQLIVHLVRRCPLLLQPLGDDGNASFTVRPLRKSELDHDASVILGVKVAFRISPPETTSMISQPNFFWQTPSRGRRGRGRP